MGIKVKTKGKLFRTTQFLSNVQTIDYMSILQKYGEDGVRALKNNTPKDTGLTAESWSYEIDRSKNGYALKFRNSNFQNGVPIAIILQYGHATRNGGWVEGRDYINPSVRPVFDRMASELWREVLNA